MSGSSALLNGPHKHSQSFYKAEVSKWWPWANTSQHVFVSNALLEHSHVHMFIYIVCDYFLVGMAELNSCDRDSLVPKALNIYCLAL